MNLAAFDTATLESQLGPLKIPENNKELDSYGAEFNVMVTPKGFGFSPKDYWLALKHECHLLICGKNDKYDALRNQIAQHGKRSQTAIVGMISVFIGTEIGVEAGVITPYIALLLGFALRLGKEAYCSMKSDQG